MRDSPFLVEKANLLLKLLKVQHREARQGNGSARSARSARGLLYFLEPSANLLHVTSREGLAADCGMPCGIQFCCNLRVGLAGSTTGLAA